MIADECRNDIKFMMRKKNEENNKKDKGNETYLMEKSFRQVKHVYL